MEEELKIFFNEISKKHPSIKFDQKYSKSKIEFLDVLAYKHEQQTLQTTLFKNKTDRQSYLYAKSDQPASLKRSIIYSQILCNYKVLQEQSTKRG